MRLIQIVSQSRSGGVSNDVTGITYGGVSMSFVDSAKNAENRWCIVYYLGTGIPTGTQSVSVSLSSSKAFSVQAIGITASNDTELAGIGSAKTVTTGSNPSVSITGISGASYGFGFFYSGLPNTGDVTAGSGMTMRLQRDVGPETLHAESRTSELASGNMTIAFTASSDTVSMVGVAVQESTPSGPANLKTLDGTAKASIKTINGTAIASVKTYDGIS